MQYCIFVFINLALLFKWGLNQCVISNHRHSNKFINVYSQNDVDALWVNLTIDDLQSRETSLLFNVKFDYTNPKPLLENVMVNDELLCAAGGQPAISATAGALQTRIPTIHRENKPTVNPIRDQPDGSQLASGINPSPANCVRIPLEKPTDFYYWKEYDGEVPKDAFVAAIDRNRKEVYIGSGLYQSPSAVMPGPTYAGNKASYSAAFGTIIETTHNVKILCTPKKDKLRWVKVHLNDIEKMKNCHFIQGGHEYSYPGPLLIGRLQVADDYAIGKVVMVNDDFRGFESFHNGKHYFKVQKFEALAVCN